MANNSSSFTLDLGNTTNSMCLIEDKLGSKIGPDDFPNLALLTWKFLSLVNGISTLPTIIFNAMVVWAVLGDEDLRSFSYNILLVMLAMTDFLVGSFASPIFSFYLRCHVKGCNSPCIFTTYLFTITTCTGLSISSLSLVSMERYLAIEHPVFYSTIVTVKRVIIVQIICWVVNLSILMSIIVFTFESILPHQAIAVAPSVSMGLHALVTLYSSIKVQVTAHHQRRTIALQQFSVQQPEGQQLQQQEQENQRRLQDYKRVFMTTVLIFMTIFCYTPLIAVSVIQAAIGRDALGDYRYIAMPISVTMLHLQSFLNPLLVSLRLSYIRKNIKKLHFFNWNPLVSSELFNSPLELKVPENLLTRHSSAK